MRINIDAARQVRMSKKYQNGEFFLLNLLQIMGAYNKVYL